MKKKVKFELHYLIIVTFFYFKFYCNTVLFLRIFKITFKLFSGLNFRYSWDIGFVSPGGNYPSLIPTSTSLDSEPGPISITPTTTVQGGTRMRPIFGDFLRTAHDAPQVIMLKLCNSIRLTSYHCQTRRN